METEKVKVTMKGSGGAWEPHKGIEVSALMAKKGFDDAAAAKVTGEAARILSMCLPPDCQDDERAGLVIGYVQSGKTLSFTTVTALARDNGYRLIIVLAGTKTNLLDQNEERLTGDLGIIEERGRYWRVLVNPRADNDKSAEVQTALDTWDKYPGKPERCRTLLIVVMKNAARLNQLAELLSHCNLNACCALLIDDEGDQAGLNTRVRQNAESPTYASILALRSKLPAHTYLQYTATPQAPLLISRIDKLSPAFAELLTPGGGYVGGKELFRTGSPFVEIIPADDLPDVWLDEEGPPSSLIKAMRLFFIGVAAGVMERKGNRSMMIHPSHLRASHDSYAVWARGVRKLWQDTLREPQDSPDRKQLESEFLEAYQDLSKTASDLPPFEEIWGEMDFAIDETRVQVVNASAGRIESFPWSDSYGWILIGGAGLDRGFTVEGLTVTYMPRGAGTKTADTIQQRARFFGYKQSYLGIVRIFIEQEVNDAFDAYVRHEENLRASLAKHQGQPMSTWRRLFFLDSDLQPTRRSVMALDIMRGRYKEWINPEFPHDEDVIEPNRATIESFIDDLAGQWNLIKGSSGWTSIQKHKLAEDVPLSQVYEHLLVPLMVSEEDANDHLMVTMQVREILDHDPHAVCNLYEMSSGEPRERAVKDNGAVENLYQGSNASTKYPGDRKIKTDERVSIQLHKLNLHTKPKPPREEEPIADDVWTIATHIPEKLSTDIAIQDDA